jgi:tripartite-type tricarboxylate transporter receptor subunit TctC
MKAVLCLAGLLAGLSAFASPAMAAFPEKDISFIIPTGPGGTFDTFVRAIAHAMERYLPNKVHVVPVNVPGASGGKASGTTFRAKPDGYTIQIFDIPGALLPQIAGQPGIEYDLTKFTWLAFIGNDPYGIAVPGKSPIKSVADLKALGRPVKFVSTGPGATSYLATRITTEMLGLSATYITGYRGASEYIVGAIRGDGDCAVAVIPVLNKFKPSGDLRVIAYLTGISPDPGVANAKDIGQPDLAKLSVSRLVGGPPGIPAEIKAVLEDALLKAMKDPDTIKAMATVGANMDPEPGADAARVLQDNIGFYSKYREYILEGQAEAK